MVILVGFVFLYGQENQLFAMDLGSTQEGVRASPDVQNLLSEVELKKTKAALASLEGQYKLQLNELNENIKTKEEKVLKLQQELEARENAIKDFSNREKENLEFLQQHQLQIKNLEKEIESLHKSVQEGEKSLSEKESELEEHKEEVARLKEDLAKADADLKLFDQKKKEIKDLSKKLSMLSETLADRESILQRKEKELKEQKEETGVLNEELRTVKANFSKTTSSLSKKIEDLEKKIRQSEKEKASLRDKLEKTQISPQKNKGLTKDPFLDRDFRMLTETLVKKEERIKQLEAEIAVLKGEKTKKAVTRKDVSTADRAAPEDAQKKAEELKRQIEILLESQQTH